MNRKRWEDVKSCQSLVQYTLNEMSPGMQV